MSVSFLSFKLGKDIQLKIKTKKRLKIRANEN